MHLLYQGVLDAVIRHGVPSPAMTWALKCNSIAKAMRIIEEGWLPRQTVKTAAKLPEI